MTRVLPKISVIILTFNRSPSDVLQCLNSVRLMSYPNFEVNLIDNSPESPSAFSSIELRDIRLIDITGRENLGVSGGRNVGIKHSTGEYLFFVDDDVVLDKNCLLELVKIAESDSSIGILGPLTYRYDSPSEKWFYTNSVDQDSEKKVIDVSMVVGAAFMAKKEVIQRIGLFDENCFLYHEEWDLCYRAQKAGYRTVVATEAYCWHKVPKDELSKLLVPRRAYYWHRNFFILAGRHKKATIGAFRFLFKHLIYYGGRSFPGYFVIFALKNRKINAVKSYFHGILDGLVFFAKFILQ